MKYAIVIERSPTGFAADVERLIREAIQLHLEGMREDGEPIPEPTTGVDLVEV